MRLGLGVYCSTLSIIQQTDKDGYWYITTLANIVIAGAVFAISLVNIHYKGNTKVGKGKLHLCLQAVSSITTICVITLLLPSSLSHFTLFALTINALIVEVYSAQQNLRAHIKETLWITLMLALLTTKVAMTLEGEPGQKILDIVCTIIVPILVICAIDFHCLKKG